MSIWNRESFYQIVLIFYPVGTFIICYDKIEKIIFLFKFFSKRSLATVAFFCLSKSITKPPLDLSFNDFKFDFLFKIAMQTPCAFTPSHDPPSFLSFPAYIKGNFFQWNPGLKKFYQNIHLY